MRFIKLIGSSLFKFLTFLFVFIFLLGVLNIYFSFKNDYCLMTYMYEYPQYVRIDVPEIKHEYPQYGLHSYSEGRFTERARKMWFDGIPVLFLPGNSGSHMQARSLASVALRKALSKGSDYYFDYFTVSYNEELSGLYGGVLQHQTEFAAACIDKILSLYKSNKFTKTVPTSVILIGHSMGGLIAKRLLVYPRTMNTTSIAITLAAPLEAPVINMDVAMNQYYLDMELEWEMYVNRDPDVKQRKLLLSFGGGPRDILMPSGLTSSNDSYINALTTAIPGVWVSPNHVSIVWCKQMVLAVNRFLFDIVDRNVDQISQDMQLVTAKARQYFKANRSMTLNPSIIRPNISMLADAFWYEDNRRIYQIARPDVDRTTYLMIRLVSFPQNRFVAIEAVNLNDNDWIFVCNAKFTYNAYRYCKQATSITELSRWTGAAKDYGKRKLATIHLHNLVENTHDWSHVIVKISPTRKPVTLNVDINDYESRKITVKLPFFYLVGRSVIKEETEKNSLYYELTLPGFYTLYQSYLLYVEPTSSCRAVRYHVSAEMHVPWAENHENFHYFTDLKHSPMKLRLFKTNPNISYGLDAQEHVKITILLDPQCTFRISIATSWYHRVAQFTRNYAPILIPYMAAIVLLAARSSILSLNEHGTCMSIHGALMSEGVKPYYGLVFARLGVMIFTSVPVFAFLFENASSNNFELHYFSRSLLVVPLYMTALGLLNIAAAAIVAVMVFSSQLTYRLLFRIVWRGGPGFAEKVASVLHKVPTLVSVGLSFAVPFSCGAAALVAGAAFYAFMLSKMYEEYLEDYVYKIMAKVASKLCRIFTKNKSKDENESETTSLVPKSPSTAPKEDIDNVKAIEEIDNKDQGKEQLKDAISETAIFKTIEDKDNEPVPSTSQGDVTSHKDVNNKSITYVMRKNNVSRWRRKQAAKVRDMALAEGKCETNTITDKKQDKNDIDEDLNSLNFHMMMFFLWLTVTLVNVPALITWARNFNYKLVLVPDTSYYPGFIMSACSGCVWQIEGPRGKLRLYEHVAAFLFAMAVAILVIGPTSLVVVNYGVTFIYLIITVQQLFDKEKQNDDTQAEQTKSQDSDGKQKETNVSSEEKKSEKSKDETKASQSSEEKRKPGEETNASESKDEKRDETTNEKAESSTSDIKEDKTEDCLCNENRIYNMFKTLRDKFSFSEEL